MQLVLIVKAVLHLTQFIRCDKMEFKEKDIWTDEEFAQKCFATCLNHRYNHGYNDLPTEMSCRYDQCKSGCPLAPEE